MTKRGFKELGFARAVELADGLPTITVTWSYKGRRKLVGNAQMKLWLMYYDGATKPHSIQLEGTSLIFRRDNNETIGQKVVLWIAWIILGFLGMSLLEILTRY